MNCPRCQMQIATSNEAFCPHCGYALQPPQPEAPTTSTPTDVPFAPSPAYPAPVSPQMPSGPYSGYGAPPSGSLYGPGMPPPPYSAYPPYSGYPPYPPYGVPAPSSTPFTMSPSWALPAPPKRRNYALVALVVLLLVAVVAGSSAALYLVANRQHSSGVLLASTPTPTPEYTQVENDPLTSGADGWREDSHCFLSGGSYHVKDGWYCYAPLNPFANGDISVQVKQISGQSNWFYGMVFRGADNGDLYALFIDSVGEWEFSKLVNRAWSELVPYVTTNALHRGLQVSNTLEVRMNATHFDFYLNGIKVGQANDATLTSGFAGVIGSEKIEVAFNNFDAKVIN